MIKTIRDLSLAGKRVFIRVDFNVALDENGRVVDDTRMRAVLPTIEYATQQKAKVILASHLGRPKGSPNPKYSLLPVAEHLAQLLKKEVILTESCVGDAVKKLVQEMRESDIVLLENLRFHSEEEKNDESFSEKLAALADVYVNDAFGTVHRTHASTVGMVKFFKEKAMGFLIEKEVNYINSVLQNPDRPLVAILGGAKISDKLGVVDYLISKVDALLIGGAMAYTFLKAQGFEVGNSLVDASKLYMANKFIEKAKNRGVPLLLPVDHQVASELKADVSSEIVEGNIPVGKMALDIGPKTVELFRRKIVEAKTIIWNGPMGAFETPPFDEGTMAVAKCVAQNENALSLIGGGDSAAAISQAGLTEKITHISTGGGATLACLEGKTLPGLKALE